MAPVILKKVLESSNRLKNKQLFTCLGANDIDADSKLSVQLSAVEMSDIRCRSKRKKKLKIITKTYCRRLLITNNNNWPRMT